MRSILPSFGLVLLLAAPPLATAGGYNRVYLVPALAQCQTVAPCTRAFESAVTVDTIVLMNPATKWSSAKKPVFILDVRGVRDAAHALVTGNLTVGITSGRVSLPTFGTLPDDSPLAAVAPVVVPIKNGSARFAYKLSVPAPNGTITNGGGVEVLDPDGKLLAVTGTQSKP
ncbi:MAG: hypothetical protein ACREQL_11780 [Candidatus Binatia bacterium]